MIGTQGLLIRLELRLRWRSFSKRGWAISATLALAGLVSLALHFGAWAMLQYLLNHTAPTPRMRLFAALLASTLAGLMLLASGITAGMKVLAQRGDLDLLLAAPVPPHQILLIRLAVSAFAGWLTILVIVSPMIDMAALMDHPAWLAAYPVAFALSLVATAVGAAIAVLLQAAIGQRAMRMVANTTAALLGLFVAALLQGGAALVELLPRDQQIAIGRFLAVAPINDDPRWWVARATLAEPWPLASTMLGSVMLFAAITVWLGNRFATGALAPTIARPRLARDANLRFRAATAQSALRRKERLALRRGEGLIADGLTALMLIVPILAPIMLRRASAIVVIACVGAIASMGGILARVFVERAFGKDEAADIARTAPLRYRAVVGIKLAVAGELTLLCLAIPAAIVATLAPAAIGWMLLGVSITVGTELFWTALLPPEWERNSTRKGIRGWAQSGRAMLSLVTAFAVAGAAAGYPWLILLGLIQVGALALIWRLVRSER